MLKSIRGGMGFGDALYVQSVARHIVKSGQKLRVRTAWPDVFRPLEGMVETVPFARQGVDILAHYSQRKPIQGTTQFQDCCISAGIKEPVEMRLDWKVVKQGLADKVRQSGKPVLVVQLPRTPMGRTDGFGASLLPDCRVIQRFIDEAKPDHFIVQIGAGEPLFKFRGIDMDLANKTSVCETIDVASVADRFLGYVSFLVPLAESFGKPALFVWSRKGLKDRMQYVRQITPQKVLHQPTSKFVFDDEA
jgi:hypothetical protein